MSGQFADMAIVVVSIAGAVTIAVVAMALSYMKQMERIKRQPVSTGNEVASAVEALRKEVADLRETSTRYDVSFDTALQRMESRIAAVERRTGRLEQDQSVGVGKG